MSFFVLFFFINLNNSKLPGSKGDIPYLNIISVDTTLSNRRENPIRVEVYRPNGELADEISVLPGKDRTHQNVYATKEAPKPFVFKFYDQSTGRELWLSERKSYNIPLRKLAENAYAMKGDLTFDDKGKTIFTRC